MNTTRVFFRILSYGYRTGKYIPWYIVFMLLAILFGMLNITMLIPLLNVLFSEGAPGITTEPVFTSLTQFIHDYFYYVFNQVRLTYGASGTLYYICFVVMISVLFSNIFRYLSQRMMLNIRTSIVRNIRSAIYDKITGLDLAYFSRKRKGDLMSVISNDLQSVEDSVVASLQTLFRDPLIIILYFGVLFYMSVSLTLFTLIILPITGILIAQLSKKLKKDSTNSQQLLGNMLTIAEETISGVRIVKAFNAHNYIRKKFQEENDKYNQVFRSMSYKRDAASPITEFIAYSVIISIILFVGPKLLSESADMKPGEFIGFVVFYVNILTPAKNISNAFAAIQRGLAAGTRIFNILDEESKIMEIKDAVTVNKFESEIAIEGLSFSYAGGEDGYVLKDINLVIPKGKMVALVGHSGSGKTTLSDMIPRYYDPSDGYIYLDGTDIRKYKLNDLRKLMGVVSQESILFNDTVIANIAFGLEKPSLEKVMEAARIANAHSFITELPQGYFTNIGDRGGKLSGGQRQRISIARAVFHNPPILILDEATSALDTESEKIVQEALYNLMRNRTSIVIAHRLSTVQHADLIIVMDKGMIVQRGTHESLILESGIYRQLNEMQKLT